MLEAMACGTPVVATDCPHGPREVLAGGACGVLVPPGDSGALSAAIAQLLDDPQRRRALTQRGLERADELSVQRMARRYQAAFEALMPPREPAPEQGSGRRGDGPPAPGGQAANAAAPDRTAADPVSCRTETRPAGAQASPSMRRNLTETERPIMTAKTNAAAQPGQSASDIDTVLARIGELPPKWHVAGSVGIQVLRAIAGHLKGRRIRHSAETGAGKTTLLFSHLSEHHTVFTIAGSADTINLVSKSPIVNLGTLEFVEGPSQLTLPRHDFPDKLQLAMIDGPHGYPFPDMEYWCLYPHLEPGALLIVDDIQIPTIYNLFRFIAEDEMFKLLEVVSTTAIFERTAAPTFEHLGDGWWLQNYNKARHPIKNFDIDPGDVHSADIKTLIEQQKRLTNQVRRMGDRLEEQNLAKLGPRLQRMMRRLGLRKD
jgi:hypothetical protein